MSRKELEITCPCCASRLAVDARTEKVVRWNRPEELDSSGRPKMTATDWDQASQRALGRTGDAEGKFDQALSKERSRPRDLDALFDELRSKGDESEDDEER